MNHSGAVTSAGQILSASPSRGFDSPFQVTRASERQQLALAQQRIDLAQELRLLEYDLEQEGQKRQAIRGLVTGAPGNRMASPRDTLAAIQQLRGPSGLGDPVQGFNTLLRGLIGGSADVRQALAGRTVAAGTAAVGSLLGS